VAKLLIFRGETLHDERELTGETLRIGRSPQNDIVLEDSGKGVSRNHAELRFRDGRYTLVDLESQNGIWVSGSRVPSVALDPNVVASVGPFRLLLEAPAQAASETGPDTGPIDPTQFLERSTDPLVLLPAEPSIDAGAPAPPRAAGGEPPAAKPAPKPSDRPSAKSDDDRPRTKTIVDRPRPKTLPPDPPAGGAWYAQPRVWGGAIAAILVIAVIGFTAFKLTQSPPKWNPSTAEALIAMGRCQEAIEKELTPALQADPNNQEARALIDKCQTPPPPAPPVETTSTVPPTPTIAERLDEADKLVEAKECAKAGETVTAVLAEDPNNERAKALSLKVTACLTPAPAPPALAVSVPPSEGGLEPKPKETDRAYKSRIDAMRKKFEEAVAVLESGRLLEATRSLDDIARQVPAGYLDLAQRQEQARSGVRAEAKARFDAARQAENRNDYDAAIEGYRRAHELDPAIPVDGVIQSLNARKAEFGRKRCNEGKLAFSFGDNAKAIPALQEALKYLPANDECAATARQYLKQLVK
jgi:tetratricopeptide (TPR) repeat protein